MIVQPDFPEHWKTRLLVELTGDESAPMAAIRLWAHCQHSRRSYFPDMTPAQLASICRWGDRKPACHVVMVKAGFVDKLTPKGFAAHQWNEHNAQLLQKWDAGKKGGRPPNDENHSNDKETEKPTDNRPITGTKPDQIDQTDQTDPMDQTRKDQTDPTEKTVWPGLPPESKSPGQVLVALNGSGLENSSLGCPVGSGGSVSPLIDKSVRMASLPSVGEVKQMLKCLWGGAENYAADAHRTLKKNKMRGNDGEPIANLGKWLKGFAEGCARNEMKEGKPKSKRLSYAP